MDSISLIVTVYSNFVFLLVSVLVGCIFLSIPHFIENFKCIVTNVLTVSSHISNVYRILSEISFSFLLVIYIFGLLSSSLLHGFTKFMS